MSLALYRKYRPTTFAEVKGQDHATVPLMQALAADRVNHAYLFSGPRGCGKTSSARILARSLNCATGITPEPCGVCDSCVALEPNGPGRLDVIEIDAASHGGVDDARDLRDGASYAPVADRFKVYIIDEAHMVTPAGFNALLKLVEEPPPFVKFVFATTEPEKVLGTIRSRTHHYAFRLVPPPVLKELLAQICAKEQVTLDPLVLPLVVRAGAGSVRDALSVLDQLLSGVGPEGLTYSHALAQLGVTAPVLLDEVVDALAAGDAATVYLTVERLVESGHDVRRFATDLLDRLRDLVLLDAVPAAADSGLVVAPAEGIEAMIGQARAVGTAGLARAASLLADGLTEMRGATAPRLVLELVVARILLTSGDRSVEGLATRMEQLERRLILGAPVAEASPAGRPAATRQAAPAPAVAVAPAPPAPVVTAPEPPAAAAPAPTQDAPAQPPSAPDSAQPPAPADDDWPEMVQPGTARPTPDAETPDAETPDAETPDPEPEQAGPEQAPPDSPRPDPGQPSLAEPPPPEPTATQEARPVGTAPGTVDVAGLRRVWPDVLDRVKALKRTPWMMLSDAQVLAVDGPTVRLGFPHSGLSRRFAEPAYGGVLVQALTDVLGGAWRIDCLVLGETSVLAEIAGPGAEPVPGPDAGAVATPERPAYEGFADGDEAADEEPDDPDDPAPRPPRQQPEDVAVALLQQGLGARPLEDPRR